MGRVSRSVSAREVLARDLLDAIDQALAKVPDSPQKRQLGSKAEAYRRTLQSWRVHAPSQDQRDALYEMVIALQTKLLEVLRRESLDLTPGVARVAEEEEPPSTPIGRVRLRSPKDP